MKNMKRKEGKEEENKDLRKGKMKAMNEEKEKELTRWNGEGGES